VTQSVRNQVEKVILQFLSDRINGNSARNIPKERFPGDTRGFAVRGAFHSVANLQARACLLVRDCGNKNCEAKNEHNQGLELYITLIHQVYDDNNLAPLISLQDFFYLVSVVVVREASGGDINIRYRWNHAACQCLDVLPPPGQTCSNLPFFPNTMPGAEMTFAQLTGIMEGRFGFQRNDWLCLLGAHALGRCDPDGSGYARSWTTTPSKFDNSYFREVANTNLIWIRERNTNGQTHAHVTDLFQPDVGLEQFQVQGQAAHRGTMMLHADMTSFWDADSDTRCNITHSPGGCPVRSNEFGLVQQLAADNGHLLAASQAPSRS